MNQKYSKVTSLMTMCSFTFIVYCTFCISFPAYSQLPVACISFGNQHICPGTCTDYVNCSTNATSYQWIFPGANPSTSTDVNPVNICYSTPGIYDVTLIASNSLGSDTLVLPNYFTVYPPPPQIAIEYCVDTLFATQGFVSYQWYMNGFIINGATDYLYIASQSADYNVVAADINGCEVEAVIFQAGGGFCNCCEGIHDFDSENKISVNPNPVSQSLTVNLNSSHVGQVLNGTTNLEISIYNSIGKKAMDISPLTFNGEIDCRSLAPGIYWLVVELGNQMQRLIFTKQ